MIRGPACLDCMSSLISFLYLPKGQKILNHSCPRRGGYGKLVQKELEVRRQLVEYEAPVGMGGVPFSAPSSGNYRRNHFTSQYLQYQQ